MKLGYRDMVASRKYKKKGASGGTNPVAEQPMPENGIDNDKL